MSLSTHDSSDGQTDLDIVKIAKAIGDHLRATVLKVLANDSFGVLELGKIFEVAQPALSHHLRILADAGLVSRRKEGTHIFYQRAPVCEGSALHAIFRQIDALPEDASLNQRIEAVHQLRQEKTRVFFRSHAAALTQQREQICDVSVYRDAVCAFIQALAPAQRRKVLEVGPGNGDFLFELSRLFTHVIAVDQSAEILDAIRIKTTELDNVELRHQEYLSLSDRHRFDCLVAAMVVHHMPSPGRFFQHAAKLLRKSARLIIVELTAHDQEWVREHCGDVWLGFEENQIRRWADKAGFHVSQRQYLAQRNGFNVQVICADKFS